MPPERTNQIHAASPGICSNYTAYLKTVTSDLRQPFLVDVNPVFKDRHLLIYITISSMHLGYRRSELHTKFTLEFEGRVYPNQFDKGSPLAGCNQLFFDVPTSVQYQQGDIVTITLRNLVQNRIYSNVHACVSVPEPVPLPLVTCSYISDYNTIAELRSWIAFQRVVNVSKVVFYMATPIPSFYESFRKWLDEGYIEVIDYTWPRLSIGMQEQCNNQQSQVNSCFYRYKYRANAVVLCDVDEYVYSESYPFDLPAVVRMTQTRYPKYDLITVVFLCSL